MDRFQSKSIARKRQKLIAILSLPIVPQLLRDASTNSGQQENPRLHLVFESNHLAEADSFHHAKLRRSDHE